jgi:hypothetical protein
LSVSADNYYLEHEDQGRTKMRILDYKTQKTMNDVGIFLSKEEAEELLAYLQRLVQSPAVQRVHLSEIVGSRLERELTVALDGEPHPLAVARTA